VLNKDIPFVHKTVYLRISQNLNNLEVLSKLSCYSGDDRINLVIPCKMPIYIYTFFRGVS